MNVREYLRRRVEACLHQRPTLTELRKSEWSKQFERLMRNRLMMGAFRYGLLRDKGESGYDMVGSLKRRVEMYKETGNVEYLADVANLALLEFEHPSHPDAHFEQQDDGEHCF